MDNTGRNKGNKKNIHSHFFSKLSSPFTKRKWRRKPCVFVWLTAFTYIYNLSLLSFFYPIISTTTTIVAFLGVLALVSQLNFKRIKGKRPSLSLSYHFSYVSIYLLTRTRQEKMSEWLKRSSRVESIKGF